jgi:hypothetical protein
MSSERAPDLNAAPGLVPMSAANKPTQVDVVGDRIRVASLEIIDRALAGYLESRSPEERPETVERALRVGLMALQSASGSIDVDHVRRAFDKLLSDAADSNKKATVEVEEILRKTFSTEGGVMPATLERFIGPPGSKRRLRPRHMRKRISKSRHGFCLRSVYTLGLLTGHGCPFAGLS